MLTIRQLQIFAKVAELQSITKAADSLCLTQPAVTMQIRQLEEYLGEPVIEKIGRQIHLTSAGKRALQHVSQINQQIEELKLATQYDTQEPLGEVRLSMHLSTQQMIFEWLGKFQQKYPKVRFNIDINSREEQLQGLLNNKSDLAILGAPPPNPDFISHPLIEFQYSLVACANHPLTKKNKIILAELQNEKLIFSQRGSPQYRVMEKYFPHPKQNIIEINNTLSIKYAIKSGMGISALPSYTLQPELSLQEIAILNVNKFKEDDKIYLLYLKNKRFTRAAKIFMENLHIFIQEM